MSKKEATYDVQKKIITGISGNRVKFSKILALITSGELIHYNCIICNSLRLVNCDLEGNGLVQVGSSKTISISTIVSYNHKHFCLKSVFT